jgi:isopentenyl phosphate kinase
VRPTPTCAAYVNTNNAMQHLTQSVIDSTLETGLREIICCIIAKVNHLAADAEFGALLSTPTNTTIEAQEPLRDRFFPGFR